MDLQIHLRQGFVDMLYMGRRGFHQIVPVPDYRTDNANILIRPERAPQQPHGVEVLQPLAVFDIGFSARNIFDMPGVHKVHLKSVSIQDLKNRNPINARRFHGDGIDAAVLKPPGGLV
jgi:hypothetical protein